MAPFASIDDEALDWLAGNVTEVAFQTGEVLITEGATDRDCYFLVDGEVAVSVGGKTVGTTGPGNPEGELALLYRRPRSATTTALTPVKALLVGADAFDELGKRRPQLAEAIGTAILEYLRARFGWNLPEAWRSTPQA